MNEFKGCGSPVETLYYFFCYYFWLSDISREGVQTTSHVGYLPKLVLLWFRGMCLAEAKKTTGLHEIDTEIL